MLLSAPAGGRYAYQADVDQIAWYNVHGSMPFNLSLSGHDSHETNQ